MSTASHGPLTPDNANTRVKWFGDLALVATVVEVPLGLSYS